MNNKVFVAFMTNDDVCRMLFVADIVVAVSVFTKCYCVRPCKVVSKVLVLVGLIPVSITGKN